MITPIDRVHLRAYVRNSMNTNVDLSALSVDQLKMVLRLKEQISQLESDLEALCKGQPRAAAKLANVPRSTISPAGRAKIVAAQRRRWARERALRAAPQPSISTSTKRVLSPEARAKMAAASKERWARVRAQQEK